MQTRTAAILTATLAVALTSCSTSTGSSGDKNTSGDQSGTSKPVQMGGGNAAGKGAIAPPNNTEYAPRRSGDMGPSGTRAPLPADNTGGGVNVEPNSDPKQQGSTVTPKGDDPSLLNTSGAKNTMGGWQNYMPPSGDSKANK